MINDTAILFFVIFITLLYCRLMWVVLDISDDVRKMKDDVRNMLLLQLKEQEKQEGD